MSGVASATTTPVVAQKADEDKIELTSPTNEQTPIEPDPPMEKKKKPLHATRVIFLPYLPLSLHKLEFEKVG